MIPKRTKKYVAALETVKMLPDVQRKLTPHRGIQSELYDFLEELGWWWDAKVGEWKKGARPSSSVFQKDDGLASGAFRLRLMAHPDEIEDVLEIVQEALDTYGVQVIETSDQYPNRKGPGVRVYVTCMMSK